MGEIDPELSKLLTIRGLGVGRIELLQHALGGSRGLIEALEAGDVGKISSVPGFSSRMAVEMVTAFRGGSSTTLLRTEPARRIHTELIELLSSYMHTESSKNAVRLLLPGKDPSSMEGAAGEVLRYGGLVDGRRSEVEGLLSVIGRKPRHAHRGKPYPYVLVVEDDEAFETLRRRGLDRRCLVLSPEDITAGTEGTMIFVYGAREADDEMLPVVHSVHCGAPAVEIVPESAMEDLLPHFDRIEAAGRLRKLFGHDTVCTKAAELIEELTSLSGGPRGPERVRELVEEIRSVLDDSLRSEISKIVLTGEDAISLLSFGEPEKLRGIYREHAKLAADLVREKLKARADLFIIKYPVEVDTEAVERLISDSRERAEGERFRRKVEIAGELERLKSGIFDELRWAEVQDLRFGLGCFVKDLELGPFEASEEWMGLKGAAEISLRKTGRFQRVDYHLGSVPDEKRELFEGAAVSDSRTTLLTGANSGGKTTLLITLAQTLIMASMGLPVPADRAFIPSITNLFIYRPGRKLDAGGLESFLKELLPLSLGVDGSSLVLADELEAMTELEAASRIIGAFISEIQEREAYSVVVTHMADEVLRFTECRVDGIEAKGLDEEHNLIVDRTPRIGVHARSTPELILRKLEARSKGREKQVYSKVLEMF